MGVTIHFEGRLRDEGAYRCVVDMAVAFARRHGWTFAPIEESNIRLARVRDEADWDYVGPTRGIELHPHPSSESLRLEFDRDLYLQEFVKTQFAPLEIHRRLVDLLRDLAGHFEELTVDDEGEYWETSDEALLRHHVDACNRVLAAELEARPRHEGPVRLPSGRIVDLVSKE